MALEVMGADGNGVEKAKAHCPIFQGVMARRPDQGKPVAKLASLNGIYELQKTAHSEQAYTKGVPASYRVAVQCIAIGFGSGLDEFDVIAAVTRLDFFSQSRPRREDSKALGIEFFGQIEQDF